MNAASRKMLAMIARTVAVATLCPFTVLGQETVQTEVIDFPYSIACSACALELELVASLGGRGDSISIDPMVRLAVDSEGRFFVRAYDGEQFLVYNKSGRFIRAVGSRGDAPGEFIRGIANIMIGPGDTVFVLEVSRRVSVFSPTLDFVRTIQLPTQPMAGFVLPDSRLLVNMSLSLPPAANMPLHIVGATGELGGSFGAPRTESITGHIVDARSIAPNSDGSGVWSVPYWDYGYNLEYWPIGRGRATRISVLHAPWFSSPRPPPAPPGDYFRSTPPPSEVWLWREQPVGTIWTRVLVADSEWKPSTDGSEPVAGAGLGRFGLSAFPNGREMDERFDTVVELVDVNSRTITVSQRFDQRLDPIPKSDLLWSRREDAFDVTTIDVWRLNVTGTPPSGRQKRTKEGEQWL